MAPRVGVIIPCFNQGHFAAECVASLHAQTWTDWHAVIVDDASTDDSLAVLETLTDEKVTLVRLDRNRGRALVRNVAAEALGDVEFLLNVDCDDRLSPTYLAMLVAALEGRPSAGLAYGTLHYFGADHPSGESSWPTRPLSMERRFLENVVPGPGVLFRRAAFLQTAGWRREFTVWSGEDYDIWLQVVNAGWDAIWVREARYEYRQHPQSFLATTDGWREVEVLLSILRLHRSAIRRTSGLVAYLTPVVMPQFFGAVRRSQWRKTARIAAGVVPFAPVLFVRLCAEFYLRRLRTRVSRAGDR